LPAKWLADQGVTQAVPALIEMLDAADPHARWAAIAALERLGPPPQAKVLLMQMALEDPDRYVRGWASAALGCYDGGDEVTQLLISILDDPDWHVSQGAAIALGRRGDLVALDPLKARLRQLRRSPVQWYLHRLPFKEAISALGVGAFRKQGRRLPSE
jgi:HEAT repeat protein